VEGAALNPYYLAATIVLSAALGVLGLLLIQDIRRRRKQREIEEAAKKLYARESIAAPARVDTRTFILRPYPQRPEDWS
jgi:hypothetical protein